MRRETLARAVVPALMVALAVAQVVLTRTAHLTPWKGAGFGMFATLDHAPHRGLDIVVDGPGRSEGLAIPPSLELDAARAAACPVDWLLGRLAEGVVARERRYRRVVSRVTIDVWGTDFDRLTLQARQRPLRRFVYAVP